MLLIFKSLKNLHLDSLCKNPVGEEEGVEEVDGEEPEVGQSLRALDFFTHGLDRTSNIKIECQSLRKR